MTRSVSSLAVDPEIFRFASLAESSPTSLEKLDGAAIVFDVAILVIGFGGIVPVAGLTFDKLGPLALQLNSSSIKESQLMISV